MKINELKIIIDNIESERWAFPINRFLLAENFSEDSAKYWLQLLSEYAQKGFTKEQLLLSFSDLHRHLNESSNNEKSKIELVWTGPEALNSTLRDTGVVAQELFREAKNEVIIAGFAFYQGKELFKEIAQKLDDDPNFKVTFFVDVRRDGNTSLEEAILVKFKTDFKKKQWPGIKLPTIYFDPRTIDLESDNKSSMHAKCIIVDSNKTFITSANFTQAAHYRNIEAGVVINSKDYAVSLKSQFFNLVEIDFFKKI